MTTSSNELLYLNQLPAAEIVPLAAAPTNYTAAFYEDPSLGFGPTFPGMVRVDQLQCGVDEHWGDDSYRVYTLAQLLVVGLVVMVYAVTLMVCAVFANGWY